MKEYHKIQSVYLRDPANKYRTFLEGEWTLPEFDYLKENDWVFTEKVDGTNIRIMWNGKDITFAGKTDKAEIPTFLESDLQEKFSGIKTRALFKNEFSEKEVCFYGEGYGNKIQAVGKDYIPDRTDFILFDVRIGFVWLDRESVEVLAKTFGIEVVPIVGTGTLNEAIEKTREGFKSQWGDFMAEGLVLKPKVELKDRLGRRIITKVKHKDFT
jgi:ATP-dependent RNA circularization protein (DNA/RNA ligase family)